VSGRADLLRQRDRGGPAPATDIDDPFAGRGPGAVDQEVGDRRKQDVLRLLASAQRWPPGPFQ